MSRAKHNCKRHRQRRVKTYKILHDVYAFLKEKSDTIKLKKIRGMDGCFFPDLDEIFIDYRKEFLSTLVHEIMHSLHPHWSETKVQLTEREVMNSITIRQCKNIIRRFAAYL